jgi:hypothetical protein
LNPKQHLGDELLQRADSVRRIAAGKTLSVGLSIANELCYLPCGDGSCGGLSS